MGGHDFSGAVWRKSSRSSGNNGNCVEVAFLAEQWGKSSYSNGDGGNCVEVAHAPAVTGIRDSKNAAGPILTIPATAFVALRNSASR